MIRILLVDDHPALRAGLHTVLRSEPGLVPVGVASGLDEGLASVRDGETPDVALVDYHLADGDGLSLCRRLKAGPDPPRVLIYSAYSDPSLTIPAVLSGADGMVNKGAPAEELFEAIRMVAAGQTVLPPPPRELLDESTALLNPDDLPIFGMLMDRTPAHEIAAVLQVDEREIDQRIERMIASLRREVSA